MTDSELERRVHVAELLIEASHKDRENGVMTREQQVLFSQWVYSVLLKDCSEDVVRAVQEYEVLILSETA